MVVAGSNSSLSAFAAEAAVVGSMMFVALLLAAGMLALEREENAFGRLVRGLVSRTELVVEKVGLAALAAFVLTTVMLGILAALLGLDFARAPLWLRRAGGRLAGLRRDGRGDRRRHARGPLRVAGRLRASRCRWRRSRSCPPARSPTASTT